MRTMNIKITTINDVYAVAREAEKVIGDITVKRGNYAVDGKSILGLFSLDMSQGVTFEYPDNAIEFEKFLSGFQV